MPDVVPSRWAAWFIALSRNLAILGWVGSLFLALDRDPHTLVYASARFNGVFKACLRDGVVNGGCWSNAITGDSFVGC